MRFTRNPFEKVHTDKARVEIITEVAFQYRFDATYDCVGCDKVVWDAHGSDQNSRRGRY